MTLMDRWRRLSETMRGFLGVVALAALVAAVYGFNEREAIIAWLTPETLGARLRRECQSVVDEVYPKRMVKPPQSVPPNPFDQFAPPVVDPGWEQEREREVENCILSRGRAGR